MKVLHLVNNLMVEIISTLHHQNQRARQLKRSRTAAPQKAVILIIVEGFKTYKCD